MLNSSLLHANQEFSSPIIEGNCSFHIIDNTLYLNVDKVLNNRPLGDVSGTLAVELWGLRQPYSGGEFDGVALAGAHIGEIFGQHFLGGNTFEVPFSEPPVGTWHLTLMLREWTNSGFVTRDHINFPVPYVVNWVPELVHKSQGKILNLPVDREPKLTDAEKGIMLRENAQEEKIISPTPADEEALTPKTTTGEKTEKLEPAETASIKTPTADATQAKTAPAEKSPSDTAPAKTTSTETTPASQVKPSPIGAPKKLKKVAKAKAIELVNVNSASLAELQNLKGVSTALAKEIIARRPYKETGDLLKVKGMGAKLLEKLRTSITI
ncbi:helix-hairpin-helix domain-containing protein [Teredinibacter turnerae]|uniref:helix-hairpin-helix domain-containing protein n=1 Tax=Teredinibacter turnerae TaxID=2426 RepID=UPI00040C2DFE|nr:helix-hairpin-helix domain-containing protein [Teredinibacter turnerae]